MERWSNRVAVVTGASAGIGAATAKLLADFGMKVVACARRVEKLNELHKERPNIRPYQVGRQDPRLYFSAREHIIIIF